MKANNFEDQAHSNAVRYAIKQALYNKALSEWQNNPHSCGVPRPEDFELDSEDIENKERKAWSEIDNFIGQKKEI